MTKHIPTSPNRHLGMTLIELLIVGAIIAILITFAGPAYKRYSDKAKMVEFVLKVSDMSKKLVVAKQTGTTISDGSGGTGGELSDTAYRDSLGLSSGDLSLSIDNIGSIGTVSFLATNSNTRAYYLSAASSDTVCLDSDKLDVVENGKTSNTLYLLRLRMTATDLTVLNQGFTSLISMSYEYNGSFRTACGIHEVADTSVYNTIQTELFPYFPANCRHRIFDDTC